MSESIDASLALDVVNIRSYPHSPEAVSVREAYEDRFGVKPEQPGGWYHADDWARTSYVLGRLLPGERLLDVGLGAGQFINMISSSGKFDQLSGVDPSVFKKYIELGDNITRHNKSVAELPFEDDAFDTVTCMEVLEHVPAEVMAAGIAELRRVCRRQLIMTVPFCEPEPLSKSHVRRFVDRDIRELFPDSVLMLLDRPRMPWMLIEERFDGSVVPGRSEVEVLTDRLRAANARIDELQSRKILRLANTVGAKARLVKRRLRSVGARR